MSAERAPVGVMLVNFGVPDSPEPREVNKFVGSYVSDRRMFGAASLFMTGLLHHRRRKKRQAESVARFADLYDGDHFPYMKISAHIRRKVWARLFDKGATNVEVLVAFRYGEPSMKQAFQRFEVLGCKRILVLPLYPQSSFEFTATVHDEYIREQRGFKSSGMEYRFVDNFFKDPGYIKASAARIGEYANLGDGGDKLVFAYRAIPVKDVTHGDTYELQTAATSLAIATKLGLDRNRWTIAYIPYNHLDLKDILTPGIDETVERFGIGGVRHVAVACPGQVVDSVDTLYEIDERMRQRFERQFVGDSEGCSFTYVPALNDSDLFADALATLVYDSIDGWEDSYEAGILHPRPQRPVGLSTAETVTPATLKAAVYKAMASDGADSIGPAGGIGPEARDSLAEAASEHAGDIAAIAAAASEGKLHELDDKIDVDAILDAIYGAPAPGKEGDIARDAGTADGPESGDGAAPASGDGTIGGTGVVAGPGDGAVSAAEAEAMSGGGSASRGTSSGTEAAASRERTDADTGDSSRMAGVSDAGDTKKRALRNLPDLEDPQGHDDEGDLS